jgi:hypothetical protein
MARRRLALLAAAAVAAALLVVMLVVALSPPRFPGPLPVEFPVELADGLPDTLADSWQHHQDERLRDRLGGLAALVAGDDPLLAACTGTRDPPPATVDDPVDTVRAGTEHVRELTLRDPVEVRLLDDAEMTAQVSELFGRRLDDRRLDLEQRTLTMLGAITPGTDLAGLRRDAFARQVSGFFAGSDRVIGVRTADPATLSVLERVVLAHEYEHALTFDHLGRPRADGADARRAASAVVEGSAVLAMRRYGDSLPRAERLRLREELLLRAQVEPLAGFSPYLRAELRFPYVEGMRYVCQRWRAGGWEAVDGAYADPPASTAAVLFPERHGEVPRRPAPLGEPGGGWQRARTDDFGAAQLEWLLLAPGADAAAALDRPRQRAAGWDGGALDVWTSEGRTALGLALVDRGQGPSLCDTVRDWYLAAFPQVRASGSAGRIELAGDHQQAVLVCRADQVRLGIAPDLAAAAAIAG